MYYKLFWLVNHTNKYSCLIRNIFYVYSIILTKGMSPKNITWFTESNEKHELRSCPSFYLFSKTTKSVDGHIWLYISASHPLDAAYYFD